MRNNFTMALSGLVALFALSCRAASPRPASLEHEESRSRPAEAARASAPASAPASTGHPRFWLTAADLPRLRRWANPGNPIYADVILPRLREYGKVYDEKFFPGGKPANPFPDPGGPTLVFEPLEQYAAFFGFMSLITTDAAKSADYAGRARKLLMYAMERAAEGVGAGLPFRDPTFSIKDRARWTGDLWPLTVDWIYPTLSTQDKALIKKVFVRWAAEQVEAYSWVRPTGVQNSEALTRDRGQWRWAANNYYQACARNLTMEAATLDPGDDPDGKLRAYLDEGLRGVLYQTYQLFQNGDAAGGVPVEGAFFYGAESTGFTALWMLALQTAGYTDASKWGVGVNLATSDYWDKMLQFYPNAIAPEAQTLPTLEYLGPVYWAAELEQTENQFVTGAQLTQLAPLALIARLNGNTALESRVRWFLTNVLPGGPKGLAKSASRSTSGAILSFLLFDPKAPPAPDYRSSLPPSFYSPAQRRLEARTGWAKDASWFGSSCNWKGIDHLTDICGNFHFFRKGEWITKSRTGYSNTGLLDAPDYWNAIGVQNQPIDVGDWQKVEFERGGPIRGGGPDPSGVASVKSSYAYVQADSTGTYQNTQPPAHDVTHVSRAILWLKPDTIVTYDRVATKTAGRFKRYNLLLPSSARLVGATAATATTPRGQLLRVDGLLPAGAKLTQQPWETDNLLSLPESMRSRIRIEPDPQVPAPPEVRFLTVLQTTDGADPGAPVLLQSTGGPAFHGLAVGSVAAFFAVDGKPTSAIGLSFTAPPKVTRTVITGLEPGSHYGMTRSGAAITLTAGSTATADEAGVLAF